MALKEELLIKPFQLESVESLQITQKAGEHSILRFEALIHESNVAECSKVENRADISVSFSSGEILFRGYLEYMELFPGQDENLLRVQAVSYSGLLDENRFSRSFQDTSVTYETLMKQVVEKVSEYTDKSTEFSYLSEEKSTGEFVMQYQETDWEFLKRMASRTGSPLIAWNSKESISFYAGMPQGDALKVDEEQLKKNRSIVQDGRQKYYCFTIEMDRAVSLGDLINYDGKQYTITEAESYISGSVLQHLITVCEPDQIKAIRLFNQKICGLVLKGEVLKSVSDKVEVHIKEIDQDKPDKPYQINYMTVYLNNGDVGWYFMPEEKDVVYLRFPTASEADIFAYGAERNAEQSENFAPEVKYIRTKEGKEIRFYEKGILITAKDQDFMISIDEDNGIVIQSKKAVKIKAEEDIIFQSEKKIALSAKEKISLQGKSCKMELASKIEVDGDVKVN